MMCKCGAHLGALSSGGDPMVRTRGIVLKAAGFVLVCPKCRGDVQPTPDLAKALGERMRLILPVSLPKPKK